MSNPLRIFGSGLDAGYERLAMQTGSTKGQPWYGWALHVNRVCGHELWDGEISFNIYDYFKVIGLLSFISFASTHRHGHPQPRPLASALHSD
jgi:hypothetical protein